MPILLQNYKIFALDIWKVEIPEFFTHEGIGKSCNEIIFQILLFPNDEKKILDILQKTVLSVVRGRVKNAPSFPLLAHQIE